MPELLGLSSISQEQLFSKIADAEKRLAALKQELVRRCRPDLDDPVLRRHRLPPRSASRRPRSTGFRMTSLLSPTFRE